MSAALQLPLLWASQGEGQTAYRTGPVLTAVQNLQKRLPACAGSKCSGDLNGDVAEPLVSYAFYRKHTEKLLQRYLQASFLIGRSPTLLAESVDQGWASCRKVRTFEDALIFVLDIEKCIRKLSKLDLQIISRVVIQNNTQKEAAALIGINLKTLNLRLPEALDRLTEKLVKADLLTLPG